MTAARRFTPELIPNPFSILRLTVLIFIVIVPPKFPDTLSGTPFYYTIDTRDAH